MNMAKYILIIDHELFKLKKYKCDYAEVEAKWLVSYYIYKLIEEDMIWVHGNHITIYGIPVYIVENVDKEYIRLVVEL